MAQKATGTVSVEIDQGMKITMVEGWGAVAFRQVA